MLNLDQVAISADQFLNTCLGGMADETLSARAHRMREKKQPYWNWTANFIDKLFFWQEAHCYQSYLSEINRKQLPSVYREL